MGMKSLTVLFLAGLLAATSWAQTPVGTQEPTFDMTTLIPHGITTADRVDTPIGTLEFFDGIPIGDTTQKVYDYVDRARAVEVFINLIPAVSVYHLRQGMRDIGLTESNQILIAENLGDSKPLVLTWNNTSLYTWGFLDLRKDGPTVIELPPGVLGALDDMYFRYIVDLGAAGLHLASKGTRVGSMTISDKGEALVQLLRFDRSAMSEVVHVVELVGMVLLWMIAGSPGWDRVERLFRFGRRGGGVAPTTS